MTIPDHSLLEFLIISQCRVREHYLVKLRACLDVLGDDQLRMPIDAASGNSIEGVILHILEHPRRHAAWMDTGVKPPNDPPFEAFFPSAGASPVHVRQLVDETFHAWDAAMTRLIAGVHAGGSLPEGGPGMGAIYHLVEHVAYHPGQMIAATERVSARRFDFCLTGIDERALRQVVETEMAKLTESHICYNNPADG